MDTVYGKNPTSYLGVKALNPPDVFLARANPSALKTKDIGSIWINELNKTIYFNILNSRGEATWTSMLPTPYVVGSGSANGEYSSGNYSSIQDAIDQAIADGAADFQNFRVAFILVLPGVYVENITVPSGVLLSGYSMGNNGGALILGKITIDSSFGSISNFLMFGNGSDSMIDLNQSSTLNSIRCNVYNCQLGYDATAVSSVELFSPVADVIVRFTNCKFQSQTKALDIGDACQADIEQSEIQGDIYLADTSNLFGRYNYMLGSSYLSDTAVERLSNCYISSEDPLFTIGAGNTVSVTNSPMDGTAGSGVLIAGTGTVSTGSCPVIGTATTIAGTLTHNTYTII